MDAIADAQASAAAAEATEQRRLRLEAAVQAVCTPGHAVLQPDGFTVHCYTHRGYKTALTGRVQL